jgi:hypothetical protein
MKIRDIGEVEKCDRIKEATNDPVGMALHNSLQIETYFGKW